jgi:hypothetical protein
LNLPFCWRNFKRFGYISACESSDKDEAEENEGEDNEYGEVSHGHLLSFIHPVFFVSILFLPYTFDEPTPRRIHIVAYLVGRLYSERFKHHIGCNIWRIFALKNCRNSRDACETEPIEVANIIFID